VGTFGGSEDHTAMLNCRADTLSQFSFAPSVFERDIPFPADVAVLIASSGVEAVKTAAAMELYNRASLRARKAAAAYNRATGANCRHLREIALRAGKDGLMEASKAIAQGAAPDEQELDLPGRFEQFFREDQQLIPAVGDALLAGNVAALGKLLDESHNLADRGLQNQIPQTRFLQQAARELGAMAATYFGAGFGGSVYALVEKPKAEQFLAAWREKYQAQFPDNARHSEFFATRPGHAAKVAL
jgi:galactokinase